MAAEGIRARVRAELTAEIKRLARQQLAAEGASALSLRAVARDLGIASSAIYRYFASRDELLTALIVDAYNSLGEAAEQADESSRGLPTRDRWLAICRGVRQWARAQPHEYALIFGSPVPGYAAPTDTIAAASRVPLVLMTLHGDIAHDDPTPSGMAVPPSVHRDLVALKASLGHDTDVDDDLMVRGLMAWTYLFGAISFELFGHRHNVVDDLDAFFVLEMSRIADFLRIPPA